MGNDNEELRTKTKSSNREVSIYEKSDNLNTVIPINNNRKSSTSSAGSNSNSFTQRLIDRGVAVPTSFSNWDKVKSSDDSSSPGSFDFEATYGMSPFITPSFSTAAESGPFYDGPLYKSLRHRYERERNNTASSVENSSRILITDDEDESSSEYLHKVNSNTPSTASTKRQGHKRAEDSDIELSDEEDNSGTSTPTQEKMSLSGLLPLTQRPRRSRSPLAFPPAAPPSEESPKEVKTGFFDIMKPQNYELEEKPGLSPSSQRIKNLLINIPKNVQQPAQQQQQSTKPLPSPPRKHLLHTPVFQVVNANTVKDRYLFLFNDLLLICKPIMDENIIVSTNSSGLTKNGPEKSRYRFRPNEHSLFQVKNIVQLAQLTLYISKDDYYSMSYTGPTTIEIGPDGRPILPPARKIHPIMASALRKFETNANLGIQYLIDKGVLTNDPLSIANFLFKTPDLNRRQLGYYLSDPKSNDVYDAFLECFRLVGLRLDEALRILLTTFRLPSNWESLEYLIERFAKKWHDANQNVIKFHEDMVVKVVVATLFLNAEIWYDAASERDVFWYARELKERLDRQAKRKMSVIDYHRNTGNAIQKPSSSATTSNRANNNNRQSVAVEPLHYIMSLRARGNSQPNLEDFLERWNYYDQYHLVPREFMEEMYKSICDERLETGWDNKSGRRVQPSIINEDSVGRPKVVSPSVQQGSQDVVITVIPHRLPSRLTKGLPSHPITISIPNPDKGLQIKLRGQDLIFVPNVLDFSNSCIQSFTITGNTLGRTSLMFIKTGENAGNYVSPTLPRTKSVVVERPFMRYTFQIGFKHIDPIANLDKELDKKNKMLMDDDNKKEMKSAKKSSRKRVDDEEVEEETDRKPHMVNRKYTFSVETEEERIEWLEALKKLSGYVNDEENEKVITQSQSMSSESRVALQVLKEVLLADEIKKGTARTKSSSGTNNNITGSNNGAGGNESNGSTSKNNSSDNHLLPDVDDRHGRAMRLLLPKKKAAEEERIVSTAATTANVVTKRGHEIVKLVVQNSMVPLVLGFLKNQISS